MMQVPVLPLVTPMGLPRNSGLSSCSMEAKKAFMSTNAMNRGQCLLLSGIGQLILFELVGVGCQVVNLNPLCSLEYPLGRHRDFSGQAAHPVEKVMGSGSSSISFLKTKLKERAFVRLSFGAGVLAYFDDQIAKSCV